MQYSIRQIWEAGSLPEGTVATLIVPHDASQENTLSYHTYDLALSLSLSLSFSFSRTTPIFQCPSADPAMAAPFLPFSIDKISRLDKHTFKETITWS
jgi:hypothetical protein